jgi:hypothetical protein
MAEDDSESNGVEENGVAKTPQAGEDAAQFKPNEDDSAVWTSADRIPYESALPPEVLPPELEPVAAPEPTESAKAPEPDKTPDRRAQFRRFMEDLTTMENPTAEVARLSRFADEPEVVAEAVSYLEGMVRKHRGEGHLVEELIFAMSGAVHLDAGAARPVFEDMVRQALDQIESVGGLPQLEEHFALAAMEALGGASFSSREIFDEYDAMVSQTSEVLDSEGDESASGLVLYHGGRYAQRIRDILGLTPAPPPMVAVAAALGTIDQVSDDEDIGGIADETAVSVAQDFAPLSASFPPVDSGSAQKQATPSAAAPVQVQPAPTAAEASTPTPAPAAVSAPTPGSLESFDTGQTSEPFVDDDFDDDLISPSGGLPWTSSLSALVAVGAGLALAILSYKLGRPFLVGGLLWIGGAVALAADRKLGLFFGAFTFLANGAGLLWYGLAGAPPEWVAPAGFAIFGAIALMFGLSLLHPALRTRFQRRSW